MTGKIYRSKTNGSLITLIDRNEEVVMVHKEGEEEGVIHTIKASTLKRWFTPVAEEEVAATREPEETVTQSTPLTIKEPVVKKEVTKPKKTVKKKVETSGTDKSDVITKFLDFVNKMSDQYGITIFNEGKNKNFYSLKADGRIYMAFTVSNQSGINLWLRSKAVEGITEFKKLNHMLDARLTISEWSMEVYQLIVKLHNASLKFQLEKNKTNKK